MLTFASDSFGRKRKLNGSYSPRDAKSLASRGSAVIPFHTWTAAGASTVTVLPSLVWTVTCRGRAKARG